MEIPEAFQVQEAANGDKLILPGYAVGNHAWKDWKLRWLRSLHIRADNSIISLGFPKFMNLGEGNEKYKVTHDDLLRHMGQGLLATLKIDGSLLIRYVVNGEVRFRTRGSFRVGVDNAFELDDLLHDVYPELLDPKLYPNDSILFEWVSPRNKIVITYDRPDFVLIGGIRYARECPWWEADPKLFTIKELKLVEDSLGVPMTQVSSLNESALAAMIVDLLTNHEIEGYVLRFDGAQRMVKVKADPYLTKHALRSQLTTALLIEMWLQWDKPEWAEYQNKFEATFDWECWNWALPAISSLFDGIKQALGIYQHISTFVETNRGLDRKEFALLAQETFNGINLSLCFMLLDGKEVTGDVWKKIILQHCKQVEMRMFQNTEDG